MSASDLHRCDAAYAHREAPLAGQCIEVAGYYDDSGEETVYSCPEHAQANPWRTWKPISREPFDGSDTARIHASNPHLNGVLAQTPTWLNGAES